MPLAFLLRLAVSGSLAPVHPLPGEPQPTCNAVADRD
jgi:hypothetical protein